MDDGFVHNFTFSPSLNLPNISKFANDVVFNSSPIMLKNPMMPTDQLSLIMNNQKLAGVGRRLIGSSKKESPRNVKGSLLGRARFRKRNLTPSKSSTGPPKKAKPTDGDTYAETLSGVNHLAEAGPSQPRQDP